MARILITGATGFLGGLLADLLGARGHETIGLVRDPARATALDAAGIRYRVGTLDGDAAIPLDGVDTIVHCAAVTSANRPLERFRDVNVEGTRRLLTAAAAAGVERFVHISSVAVHGYHRAPTLIDEDSPFVVDAGRWDFYTRTKIEAEAVAREVAAATGVRLTIFRVGLVHGLPLGQTTPIHRSNARPRYCIGDGRQLLPLVTADSIADAIHLALETERGWGHAYLIVDSEHPTFMEHLERQRALDLDRRRLIRIPVVVYAGLALAFEALFRLLGRRTRPPFTFANLRLGTRKVRYDTRRATADLGWHPAMPLEMALRRQAGESGHVTTAVTTPR